MARAVVEGSPHPVDRHVGRRVAEMRISLGHSQSDLSRALGLTFQQIQKYEKGSNRLSASKLWEAAAFLGVDINYFFAGLPDHTALGEIPALEDFPPTRRTVDIVRLSRRLSARQQKLALDLMVSMSGPRV